MTDLPTSKFEKLTSLDLRNNSLNVFPDFISTTPNIETLDLARNKFSHQLLHRKENSKISIIFQQLEIIKVILPLKQYWIKFQN